MTTLPSPGHWSYRVSEDCPFVWEILAEFCESPIAEVPRWIDEDGEESQEAKANLAILTAAPKLLSACRMIVNRWQRGDLAEAARACQAAVELTTGDTPPWDITEATSATRTQHTASTLLAALEAVIDYAENEAYSLEALKDSPEAEIEAERAWKAVEAAHHVLSEAKLSSVFTVQEPFR